MRGQDLTLGLHPRARSRWRAQRFELGFHRSDVGLNGFVEQRTLLRIHPLRARRELHAAQPRDLGGERRDLGFLEVNFAIAILDRAVALVNLGIALRDQMESQTAQRFQIGSRVQCAQIHAAIFADYSDRAKPSVVIESRRQSTPLHSHSNCCASTSHSTSPGRGQMKRPCCKRRTHNHTPVASPITTLMRDPD